MTESHMFPRVEAWSTRFWELFRAPQDAEGVWHMEEERDAEGMLVSVTYRAWRVP